MGGGHCAVCTKLIFTFERKIKVSELSSDEKATCNSRNPKLNLARQLVVNEPVVCLSCYRKLQEKSELCQVEKVNQSDCDEYCTTNEDKQVTNAGSSTDPHEYNAKKNPLRTRYTRTNAPSSRLQTPCSKQDKMLSATAMLKDAVGELKTESDDSEGETNEAVRVASYIVPAAVLGGMAAVAAAPVAIAAIGFGAGGVVAGSLAASMMSSAWTTGVGVGAVSLLQGLGAAGLGVAGTAVVGTAGGAVGAGIGGLVAKLTEDKADGELDDGTGEIQRLPLAADASDAKATDGADGRKTMTGDGSVKDGDEEQQKQSDKDSSGLQESEKSGRKGDDDIDKRKRSASKSESAGDVEAGGQVNATEDIGQFHLPSSNVGDNTLSTTTRCREDAASLAFQQEVTMAAASAVCPGASLAGTSTQALMQDGYWVTCGVEVENWTRFHLLCPRVTLKAGALTLAPSAIGPATRDVMIARKTSGTATGSCGTVSWLVQERSQRLVVMWSAPFNFNHHSNWLSVGLTARGAGDPGSSEDTWFEQMYYREGTSDLRFARQEYYADPQPLVLRDSDFEVQGIMASDHKALVKVILKPLLKEDLAPSILEKMETK